MIGTTSPIRASVLRSRARHPASPSDRGHERPPNISRFGLGPSLQSGAAWWPLGWKSVLRPALDHVDVDLEQADVGLRRHEQRRRGALLRPLVATGIEAVVNPGERSRGGVF